MDNIGDILSSLNEEDMENLKGMAKELFASSDSDSSPALPDLSGLDVGLLSKLMMPREDERIKFIQSLKPMLREERRHKADEAVRLLQMAGMLPILKESGILEKFLGGSDG